MRAEEIRHAIEILEAMLEGKAIQVRYAPGDWAEQRYAPGDWAELSSPSLLFGGVRREYRIKPEPREWWLAWDDYGVRHPTAYPIGPKPEGWENYVKVREVIE